MTIRRNGRADWSLFYCESGIMSFDDHKVTSGQVWIYPPNVPQRYIVSAADNTVQCFQVRRHAESQRQAIQP